MNINGPANAAWLLEQEGFEPSREREMESLFAIGNGYLGIRGSTDFLIPVSEGDLFVAGVFGDKDEKLPYSELEFLTKGSRGEKPEIIAFPFPFRLAISTAGKTLDVAGTELVDHCRRLDLRRGELSENYKFEPIAGERVGVLTRRYASLADRHLLMQEIEITSESFTGELVVDVSFDFAHFELRYPRLSPLAVKKPVPLAALHVYDCGDSKTRAVFAARVEVQNAEIDDSTVVIDATPGKIVRIRKFVSVFTTRERPNAIDCAIAHCSERSFDLFDTDRTSHIQKWSDFWEKANISFCGLPECEQAQRFNLYHLRIPADHDPCTSIGARGLTGRAYEGHVFWDTEIFMFPFYLYTEPEIARSLLLYRYNTLGGARRRAVEMGCKGACYAWESTVSGDDVTPRTIVIRGANAEIPVFTGIQQIHVTADVAFAVWRYWDATLDRKFLSEFGCEILFETARFWASRVVRDTGRFHIKDVIGPDEYHYGVSDNAYTNRLASFNLATAAWAYNWLKREYPERHRSLTALLAIDEAERVRWIETAELMAKPRVNASGAIEQFAGFFDLKPVLLNKADRIKAPIGRLFAWQEVNGLRVVKQADVLMIPFLFPDEFSREQLRANYLYYEPITDHGSSLSACVHAAIAARAGLADEAQTYWDQSLYFDLQNRMNNTALGIHTGCSGGTWQALVFHLLGIRLTDAGPVPSVGAWDSLPCPEIELKLTYRGRRYPLKVSAKGRVAV